MEWEIALMGLAIGILVGLSGVGGASLLTPVLVMMGIQPSMAVATDLFYNSITKFFGSIQHMRQKTINLKLTKYLACGSIPGAVIAILMLQWYAPFVEHQESVIKHALGIVLVIVALVTIAKQFITPKNSGRWTEKPLEAKKWIVIVIGFVLGMIVGFTSIGSGSLFAIVMLYLFRMKASELVGTDIAHAFLLVTVAAGLHMWYGNVNYMLAFNLLIGSIPGVIAGSSISAKVPSRPLRTFVATIILLSGIRLI